MFSSEFWSNITICMTVNSQKLLKWMLPFKPVDLWEENFYQLFLLLTQHVIILVHAFSLTQQCAVQTDNMICKCPVYPVSIHGIFLMEKCPEERKSVSWKSKDMYKHLTKRSWSPTPGFLVCLQLGGLWWKRYAPSRVCRSFFRGWANLDVTGSIFAVIAGIFLCEIVKSRHQYESQSASSHLYVNSVNSQGLTRWDASTASFRDSLTFWDDLQGLLLNVRMFKCQASQISMRVYKSRAFCHKLTLNEQTFFNG